MKRSIKGLAKENAQAHSKDHIHWSRRDFMQSVGLTTSMGMLLGNLPLKAFTSLSMNYAGETDRVLVVIRLAGGNDGLNTVVPIFDYGRYNQLRPSIGIQSNNLTNLTDELAVPSQAEGFQQLWNKDLMKIVQAVGYPDQNLSHFRSTDIWSTASDSDEDIPSGWLGRLITQDDPDVTINPPDHPSAVQIGNSGNLTFNDQDNVNLSFQVSNTNQLFQIANNGQAYPIDGLPDCLHGAQIEFVRQLANDTYRYADVIKNAYEKGENKVEFTNSSLANQLAIVSRLIKGGLKTSFYMVTLNGFDTHANQPNAHLNLLRTLSSNVDEFFQDLKYSEDDQRVLAMTASEFGRRPQQNASNGTDHGAAAPLFVFGPAVEGSQFVGEHPDLNDLDAANNLKFKIDFRQVYQTILTEWLCFPPAEVSGILNNSYDSLDLGFSCQATRTISPARPMSEIKMITHHLRHFTFSVEMSGSHYGKVIVYDIQGRVVVKLYRGILHQGSNKFDLDTTRHQMSPGMYIFTVQSGGTIAKRKFMVV